MPLVRLPEFGTGVPIALPRPAASSWPVTGFFAVRVLRDRFLGATRQLEVLADGDTLLKFETTSREPVSHVRIPVDAIQRLPHDPGAPA